MRKVINRARRETEGDTEVIQFKACPKCHGDLIDGSDQYGSYRSCIQCGRYVAKSTKNPAGAGQYDAQLNINLAQLLAA